VSEGASEDLGLPCVCSSSKPASAAVRIARDALIRSQCWITRAEHGRVQASVDEVAEIFASKSTSKIDETRTACERDRDGKGTGARDHRESVSHKGMGW